MQRVNFTLSFFCEDCLHSIKIGVPLQPANEGMRLFIKRQAYIDGGFVSEIENRREIKKLKYFKIKFGKRKKISTFAVPKQGALK